MNRMSCSATENEAVLTTARQPHTHFRKQSLKSLDVGRRRNNSKIVNKQPHYKAFLKFRISILEMFLEGSINSYLSDKLIHRGNNLSGKFENIIKWKIINTLK